MKCKNCKQAIRLNADTSPATFIKVILAIIAVIYLTRFLDKESGFRMFLLLMCFPALLFSFFAWLTAWWDASVSRGEQGEPVKGAYCKHCKAVTRVWPWSG